MTHRYQCGCPVGTPSIWRDRKGRTTFTGSMSAVTVQCCRCKKSYPATT